MQSPPSFDFSETLVRLKRGERLARRVGRDDRHIDVLRQVNGPGSIVERRGYWHGTPPWQAYGDDLMAEDWFVYDGPISNPRSALHPDRSDRPLGANDVSRVIGQRT